MSRYFLNPEVYSGKYAAEHGRHYTLPMPWAHADHRMHSPGNDPAKKGYPWTSVPEMVAEMLSEKKRNTVHSPFYSGKRDGWIWVAGIIPDLDAKDIAITVAGNTAKVEIMDKGADFDRENTAICREITVQGEPDWSTLRSIVDGENLFLFIADRSV